MELSVSELSKLLGVAPTTIERWLRQGNLPVSSKGTHCRFNKLELEKWAAKKKITLNFSEKVLPSKKEDEDIPLPAAIQNGGIYYDIQGDKVSQVLKNSIEKISIIPDDLKTDLFERLMEREVALSTGIGRGIAIPHPREQLNYLDGPVICVCFLDHPVDYNALDQKPVFVLFFILCPDLKMHLHLLSALSFCLKDPQFISFLKSKPDSVQLITKIEYLQQENTQ